MAQNQNDKELEVTLNEKSLEILVTKFIPTSQYFERSFEMLQIQMADFREDQRGLKANIDRRFEQVNQGQKELRREMDKRFEQVDEGQKELRREMDKRFEQVNEGQKELRREMDVRFTQVTNKLDQLMERVDVKLDAGLREGRSLTIKLFSFAMVFSAISMAGLLAKMTGLF